MDKSFSETYLNFERVNWQRMKEATVDTLYMTGFSLIAVLILGFLLGLLLYTLGRKKSAAYRVLYNVVSVISNVFRSTPFMILMVLIMPFTKAITGTIIEPVAALPALILSAAPFYARMVEIALREISGGVIEAANAMGATTWQIIYKVLIPESLPALVSGFTVTAVSMVGFTAMAGAIGAGGLGSLAWSEGFQLNNQTVTLMATIIILIIVFIIQGLGDFLTNKLDKR
ncbi:ABC transporter permease [Enterococcus asini]|uniref:ABC transporter permease n=2 Tax=Enterococcus asini TaxID=57732 RepID=R2SQU2_9ENTE|nr:methionine ABC transporter permease [Enterococcus asini]EOH90454.1 ABC transporter permease [Enterococcus asini ATCC 700915]EOT56914.1 ABC transporter permease [Enterococcus asini ATCC 700915]MCD5027906.1 ABC transporter permease [Enterococcus asini]MDT2743741.1 ABC transporter permease [Enterococcus asini]MDT2763604.1 ABC transporter permease [Enterococcus asini]